MIKTRAFPLGRAAAAASAALVLWPVTGTSASPPSDGAGAEPSHALVPALEPRRGDPADHPYAAGRSGFPLRVAGESVLWETMAVMALPGETVDITVPEGRTTGTRLLHGAGTVREVGPDGWSWTAPAEPGVHALQVVAADGETIHLNALVAHPRAHVAGGMLHGYRIGRYRETPLRGNPAYLPPEGFVEVAPGDEDILVSPHFTLGQFLCKQPGERRFVSLSLPLVRKLEVVLEATNRAGWETSTFHVMSGFRTPAYNRAIGNTTDYSRHLWGDAADIFVDVDRDGDMDDLNGDGRSDLADARVLYRIVEGVERQESDGVSPGGLGVYRRNAAHGPFVHVDARGTRARW